MDLTWGIHKTQQISAIITKMAFKGRWDIFYDTHLIILSNQSRLKGHKNAFASTKIHQRCQSVLFPKMDEFTHLKQVCLVKAKLHNFVVNGD